MFNVNIVAGAIIPGIIGLLENNLMYVCYFPITHGLISLVIVICMTIYVHRMVKILARHSIKNDLELLFLKVLGDKIAKLAVVVGITWHLFVGHCTHCS